MAVDIEDLVVSATILHSRDRGRDDRRRDEMLDAVERDRFKADLVAACVEEVLRVMQRNAER